VTRGPDTIATIVASTPNKGVYLEGNPFHTHELTYEELLNSLSATFKHVQLLSQENWLARPVASGVNE
jgi:hypothetical protein